MITDLILSLSQSTLNIFFLPLAVVDVAIDIVSSLPVVAQFLQVVAYIVPWTNLIPIFVITISIFSFRIVIALIKLVFTFIPLF